MDTVGLAFRGREQDLLNAEIVWTVVRQHAEDAAVLHATRSVLVRGANPKLYHLQRFDSRLEAHLDGLRVAGARAWPLFDSALERPSPGAVFVATVRAIEDGVGERFERILALSEVVGEAWSGLLSALGWMEADKLRGLIVEILNSRLPRKRYAAVAACAMHRVDPGLTSARPLEDPDSATRARAWRTAGELGRHELVSTAAAAANAEEDPVCRFWAAWSAVLLGDKEAALGLLRDVAVAPGPFQARALHLAIQAMSVQGAHELLQILAQDRADIRRVIRGAGLVGDPTYVPWLIGLMTDDKLARLAGEAFSLITGLDLAWLDLERKPPENFESGPNDDPNDPNVEMDEDDGLPWPEQKLVQGWWDANSQRFEPGTRYFMGEPLNRDNCLRVLKEGFQRQRIAAALYLSLLTPGTPLFEWRAPAWRQQRLLARMT
jgi:uncharacterized protein (TIGR02270 family)